MSKLALALGAIVLASCNVPYFKDDPGPRGISGGKQNSWVDIVVQKAEVTNVIEMLDGYYSFDLYVKLDLRSVNYKLKPYKGRVTGKFAINAFVRHKWSPSDRTAIVDDTTGDVTRMYNPDGTLNFDAVAFPVRFTPPQPWPLRNLGSLPQEPPPPGMPPPPPPGPFPAPSGELIWVYPIIWPSDPPIEMTMRGYIWAPFGALQPGERVHMVVRADIFNDIHPEHDGYPPARRIDPDLTNKVAADHAYYKTPDFEFDFWQRGVISNNEAVHPFDLPMRP